MRGTPGELLHQHGELRVVGPEIVTPLRDAMSLVDGEKRNGRLMQQREEIVHEQPLGRDVDQVEPARANAALHPLNVRSRHARVDGRRP